jgi:hypothetical protein
VTEGELPQQCSHRRGRYTPSNKVFIPRQRTTAWILCGDHPQPAARDRRPGRRSAHPRTRIDATPQAHHRPGPAGPPTTPTDPAPTTPTGPGLNTGLRCGTAPSDTARRYPRQLDPSAERPDRNTNRKSWADQQLQHAHSPDNQDHPPQRHSARPIGGSRFSRDKARGATCWRHSWFFSHFVSRAFFSAA